MSLLASLGTGLVAADRLLANWRQTRTGLHLQPVGGAWADTIRLDGSEEGEQTITFAGAVESNPIAWAVVTKLARELSTLDVIVEREAAPGRWEPTHGTSLERLLRQPAPGCGLVDLLQWIFTPALVEGNSVIGKYRPEPDEAPRNLVPLGWPFLSAYATPGGPVEFWVSSQLGYTQPRVLATSEVLHTAWLAPTGGALGRSPLKPLADSVRIDDAARRFQRAHLRNAARPSGAIVFPAEVEVSEPEREKVREAIRQMHGGVDNAFRVALMGGGVSWLPMSFSAAEAQLGDARLRAREEFCVAYDVRWTQIADGDGPVDVAALARDLHRTLRPWATLAMSALQRQLIDPEPEWTGLRARLDFAHLLRGSPQEETNLAVHGYTNGLWSLDEARARVGAAPLDTDESRVPLIPHAQLDPERRDARALPPSTDPDSERNRPDRGPDTQ